MSALRKPPAVVRAALVLFIGLFANIMVTEAQPLDAQRQSGVIGERYDGFVVAREASAEAMASKVNAERTRLYQQRAAKQGVSVEKVGQVYAKKIFEQAPAGTWFLTEKGSWIRK
jgi:uncharacterized protein YdbL (DUF1318 family)